jgi:type IV pilus assembly protein PilA
MRPSRLTGSAFTLIELMIVVTIISLLAAIAIPAFLKYVKASKTSEAGLQIRKIYDGEIAYFEIDHVDGTGQITSSQFVAAGPQPVQVPKGIKSMATWSDPGWTALHTGMESLVYYRYTAVTAGVGTGASFTARAEGDLDGDETLSRFERVGSYGSVAGEATGGAGLYKVNELE